MPRILLHQAADALLSALRIWLSPEAGFRRGVNPKVDSLHAEVEEHF